MATVIRAWRVTDGSLSEIPEVTAAQQGLLEDRLEAWLASQPDAIQDNLLIIGRQVPTASGPLDLLAITADGGLVVVELKRDRAPRETVAQAIDYASWIATQSDEEIGAVAFGYLRQTLEDAFRSRFNQPLPELQLTTPSVLVVASRLDAPTERMIEYLSQQYGMDIDGLIFRYLHFAPGEDVLVRTTIVSEEKRIVAGAGGSYARSAEQLMRLAAEHNAAQLVTALRRIGEFLSEQAVATYGGSFRYWGSGRMLCGVNCATAWSAPNATTDVWVSHGSFAEAFGREEGALIVELAQFQTVKQYPNSRQTVIRITSLGQADDFVSMIRQWAEAQPSDATKGNVTVAEPILPPD